MERFVIYYWLERSERGKPVCEILCASSFDDATRMVQERLTHPSFFFDSTNEGRVIVVSAHVRYVEIEPEGAGECLPEGMDAMDVIERMNRQEM